MVTLLRVTVGSSKIWTCSFYTYYLIIFQILTTILLMQNLYLILRIFYIWKSLNYEKIAFYVDVKYVWFGMHYFKNCERVLITLIITRWLQLAFNALQKRAGRLPRRSISNEGFYKRTILNFMDFTKTMWWWWRVCFLFLFLFLLIIKI